MLSGEIESFPVNVYSHDRCAQRGCNLHAKSSDAAGTDDHGYVLGPQSRPPDRFIRSSHCVGNNG
jgi:hypothetical protein